MLSNSELRSAVINSEVVAQFKLMVFCLSLPFLTSRGFSPLLAASLIHAAVDEVLRTDLTEFKKQSVETEEEGDEERLTCKYTFSLCGFPGGCLLEDFCVLKCFPEYLVRLCCKQ